MAKHIFLFVSALLVAVHMSSNSVEATGEDGEVVFSPKEVVSEYEMPESCAQEGKSYCFDKGSEYPEEKIAKLLQKWPELKMANPEPPTSIVSRQGDSFNEPDCPSRSTDDPIYYIIDKNDKVRVVVQSPKKFQQIYSVKWCLNEGLITEDTLHFVKETTLQKFKIQCVNTKMDFDFFVLNDDDLVPKMELVTAKGGIPVCCRCRYDVKLNATLSGEK